MVSETVKDPKKAMAGRIGSLTRWGVRRIVRLDDFDSDERTAILAIIAAKRAAKAARSAAEPDAVA